MARILAADIGGTNSRFAAFTLAGGELSLDAATWLRTREVDGFADLLDRLWTTDIGLGPDDVDLAVIAVAGAVERGRTYCRLSNADWDVALEEDGSGHGLRRALLLNDFEAQAYATRTPIVDTARVVQEGRAAEHGAVAVIGAGTGLGHCAMVRCEEGWATVPSEAGHVSFPFQSKAECRYGEFLCKATKAPYCYGDLVVSGLGLSLLHLYLTGRERSPDQVAAEMDPNGDTARYFARYYARACRNYALAVVATGGLFISGGVAARNPGLVTSQAFLDEFTLSPRYSELLAAIPIRLNTEQDSGLWGAAYFAGQVLGREG